MALSPQTFLNAEDIKMLQNWVSINFRELPWRLTQDPYAVWVAEVMLQQTTVSTVLGRWGLFLKEYPSVQALAAAPLEQVAESFAGLGYYRRVVLLHQAAKLMVSTGGFPKTPGELIKLPGFGPYMSHSVPAFAFDFPTIAVDVHLHRIACRVSARDLDSQQAQEFWRPLLDFINPSMLNNGLMDLGSLVCTKSKPKCAECPLSKSCLAFHKGTAETYPHPKPKPEVIPITQIRFLTDRLPVAQRPLGGWYAHQWDLVNLTLNEHFSAPEVLSLLISQGFRSPQILGQLKHSVTHHRILAYLVRFDGSHLTDLFQELLDQQRAVLLHKLPKPTVPVLRHWQDHIPGMGHSKQQQHL